MNEIRKNTKIKTMLDFNDLVSKEILDIPNLTTIYKNRHFLLITEDGKLYSCEISSNSIAEKLTYISDIQIPLEHQMFIGQEVMVISEKIPRFIITYMSFYDMLIDLNNIYSSNRLLMCIDVHYKPHYKFDPFCNQNCSGFKNSDTIYVTDINRYVT